MLAAFGAMALLGALIARFLVLPLRNAPPLNTLLITLMLGLALRECIRLFYPNGSNPKPFPHLLPTTSWSMGSFSLRADSLILLVAGVLAIVSVHLVINRTRLGLNVRAVTQNRNMAACCGVPTGRVDMLAFGLGSGIAGLGGVALSQVGNVGPDLGQSYIIDSFLVVVLGGVGQLAGSVFAAFGLGVANKILEPQIGAVLGKILILALIILFIQKRPQGLFALKGRVID